MVYPPNPFPPLVTPNCAFFVEDGIGGANMPAASPASNTAGGVDIWDAGIWLPGTYPPPHIPDYRYVENLPDRTPEPNTNLQFAYEIFLNGSPGYGGFAENRISLSGPTQLGTGHGYEIRWRWRVGPVVPDMDFVTGYRRHKWYKVIAFTGSPGSFTTVVGYFRTGTWENVTLDQSANFGNYVDSVPWVFRWVGTSLTLNDTPASIDPGTWYITSLRVADDRSWIIKIWPDGDESAPLVRSGVNASALPGLLRWDAQFTWWRPFDWTIQFDWIGFQDGTDPWGPKEIVHTFHEPGTAPYPPGSPPGSGPGGDPPPGGWGDGSTGNRVYRPRFISQLGWGTAYDGENCLAATSAMGVDRATLGRRTTTPPRIREASGDLSGGLDLSSASYGANVVGGVSFLQPGNISYDLFVSYINQGRAAIATGDSHALVPWNLHARSEYTGTPFLGTHSILINEQRAGGDFYCLDPAFRPNSKYHITPGWYPAAAVQAYLAGTSGSTSRALVMFTAATPKG